MDSMVAHYSVAKVRRARDEYSPGGIAGKRPDRSATVYTCLLYTSKRALAVALCGFAAFAVNAAAPGNAVRAATTATQGKGAMWAVVQSFPMSAHHARVFTTPMLDVYKRQAHSPAARKRRRRQAPCRKKRARQAQRLEIQCRIQKNALVRPGRLRLPYGRAARAAEDGRGCKRPSTGTENAANRKS